jgi:hypothetical protein
VPLDDHRGRAPGGRHAPVQNVKHHSARSDACSAWHATIVSKPPSLSYRTRPAFSHRRNFQQRDVEWVAVALRRYCVDFGPAGTFVIFAGRIYHA